MGDPIDEFNKRQRERELGPSTGGQPAPVAAGPDLGSLLDAFDKRIAEGGVVTPIPSEVPTAPPPSAPEDRPTPTWDSTDDEILAFAQGAGAAAPTDIAAQRLGEERLAEGGRLWRDIPSNLLEIASNIGHGQVAAGTDVAAGQLSALGINTENLPDVAGAGPAPDLGRPIGEIFNLYNLGGELTSALGGPAVGATGASMVDPNIQMALGRLSEKESIVPPPGFASEQAAESVENILGALGARDKPFTQSLGEHLQRPTAERQALEFILGPENIFDVLPVGGIAGKGIGSLADLARAISRVGRGRTIGGPGVRVPPKALLPGQPGTVLPQGDPGAARVTLPREEAVPEVRPRKAPSEYSFVLVDTQHPRGRVIIYTNNDQYQAAINALSQRDDVRVLEGTANSVDVERAASTIQQLQPPGQRTTVPVTRFRRGAEGPISVSPRSTQRQF